MAHYIKPCCKSPANKAQNHSQLLLKHLQPAALPQQHLLPLPVRKCLLFLCSPWLGKSCLFHRCPTGCQRAVYSWITPAPPQRAAPSLSLPLSLMKSCSQWLLLSVTSFLCRELKETMMMLCFLRAAPWKDQKKNQKK